jgi:chromosome segregation ATPase
LVDRAGREGREIRCGARALSWAAEPNKESRVSAEGQDEGLREKLSRQGEEALGKLAEELVGNPMVNAALARAFEAREKAVQAQEVAMGALGIPSAADVERLTRRLRSVSQRLEGIEDSIDRLDVRLEAIQTGVAGVDGHLEKLSKTSGKASAPAKAAAGGRATKADRERNAALEARLDEISRDLAALRDAVAPGAEPPPRAQERLTVTDA